MKTLKRFGILSVIMAVALLVPAGAAEARHRSGRSGVNVWVGPGGFGYSRGYGGYSRGYYGGYYAPYYQPYYYAYPSQSYYSYPSYGSYYYYPNPYYGGYYSPGFQFYIGR